MKKVTLFAAVIVALLVISTGQASASNLLTNGSFQTGDFTGWTQGVTSNGTAGEGYPVIAPWPLGGGLNSAKYEVGEVNFDGTYQGATLSQNFTTSGGMLNLGFMWAAMGDGIHNNADGGLFELVLDGSVLASHDVGMIGPNDLFNGTLSATANVSAGTHNFEIEILRPYTSLPGNTPYQYITGAYVNGAGGTTPEPSTLLLLGSGIAGVWLRRKRS